MFSLSQFFFFFSGCISREEFNELKALIKKVYKVVSKEKKLKYPATEAEYHMTFVRDYLANTVEAVPCKEPGHVVALNTIFGDIKFATSAVEHTHKLVFNSRKEIVLQY